MVENFLMMSLESCSKGKKINVKNESRKSTKPCSANPISPEIMSDRNLFLQILTEESEKLDSVERLD
jgi:hypothetical protein